MALLIDYSYVIVFLGVLLENAGVPVAGETVLLAAAFFAAQDVFSLGWVIGVAVAGAILGDNIGYWIGRRVGRPAAERHGRWIGLTPARLAVLDAFFRRHGAKSVFFARFVTILRIYGALVAGMGRLPWSRFLLYNAAGALTWATAVGLAGYLFGESWEGVRRWLGRLGLVALALVAALLVVAVAHRRRGARDWWLDRLPVRSGSAGPGRDRDR